MFYVDFLLKVKGDFEKSTLFMQNFQNLYMVCTWPFFHVQMYIQVQMYKYNVQYILTRRMV